MKHKIAFRLSAYFTAALLLFALIIGGIFLTLFRNYSVSLHRSELESRASRMAETLSEYVSGGIPAGSGQGSGGMGGYRSYLRFIEDIAMTDVWIVDQDLELLIGNAAGTNPYQYSDLPPDAEAVVEAVFLGSTTFSEGFSDLLRTPVVTVGTPIMADGQVVGALLLHSPVAGINEGILQGFWMLLISIAIAFVLAILLSVFLAFSFTGPLSKMKQAALRLASGDYRVRTGVSQRDEIGELASVIDVLSDRLDAASRESEKLQQLRRDFVANISHELRTPVTVIRGSLEALVDDVVRDPVQVKEYHRQMLGESLYLQGLVNDLLDLSRLQNTDFRIDMQDISLCEVLRDVVRSSEKLAIAKRIRIVAELDEGLPAEDCRITGDYGRLRQMFLILLDNAIKFSPEGAEVKVAMKGRSVIVEDHGQGIPAGDLPFIFDRFYKARSEANVTGTGLGLSIARQIAQRHGIRVDVESTVGEGSTFRLDFTGASTSDGVAL